MANITTVDSIRILPLLRLSVTNEIYETTRTQSTHGESATLAERYTLKTPTETGKKCLPPVDTHPACPYRPYTLSILLTTSSEQYHE